MAVIYYVDHSVRYMIPYENVLDSQMLYFFNKIYDLFRILDR